MRGHEPSKYETFLRPILDRLKKIDGRPPVSIMTCQIDPNDPHLQTWLKEGVSLEVHTIDHPCPLLADGDFAKAQGDVRPVRRPDEPGPRQPSRSRSACPAATRSNTPSPRFFAEIFNKHDAGGEFPADRLVGVQHHDAERPRPAARADWSTPDGTSGSASTCRSTSFVNTIEDYPYPYVIGRLCWEFPCATPSDWQAQNLHKPNNPKTRARTGRRCSTPR